MLFGKSYHYNSGWNPLIFGVHKFKFLACHILYYYKNNVLWTVVLENAASKNFSTVESFVWCAPSIKTLIMEGNYLTSDWYSPKYEQTVRYSLCHYDFHCGVMVIIVGNGQATRVQILDESDCISHSTNTLGKGMNPIILPPAMGK